VALASGIFAGAAAAVQAQKRHKRRHYPRHIDIEMLRASHSRSTPGERARRQEISRVYSPVTHQLVSRLRGEPTALQSGFYRGRTREEALASVGGVDRAVGQLFGSLLYTPVGAYELGKGVVQDVGTGDVTFGRTRGNVEAMGKSLYEDVRHPGRNPGYLIADILGAVGGGAGAAGRVASGLRAARVVGEHAGTRSIRRAYGEDLGRLETLQEAVERTLAENKPLPEPLLREYADVAKRYAVGTTSKTRAFARGFARPEKRGLETIGVHSPIRGPSEGELTRMEQELRSVFEGEPEKATLRGELRSTREAGRGGGTAGTLETLVREASDAAKAGTIYLRPTAYTANNLLGNVAFNLVHQGAFAPVNIAKSFLVSRRLGPRHKRAIDTVMGQGATLGVHGGGVGYVRAATGPLTRALHRVADEPFRESAFLHEARRAGYRTLADVRVLIDEAEKSPRAMRKLVEIGARAEEEIVKFGRLSENERALIRHLVFIWNWTKGASRYAARFPAAHPVQLGAGVQLGRMGEEHVAEAIGDVPAWMRGFIPVDVDEHGDPTLVNPLGVSPLGTGLQTALSLARTGKQLVTGKEAGGDTALDLLNPLAASSIEALTGGRPVQESLRDQIALSRLGHQLEHPGEGGTFPGTRTEALGSFFGGSLFPRKGSGKFIRERAEEERRFALSPGERAHEDYQADVARARKLFKSVGQKLPPAYLSFSRRKLMVQEAERSLAEDLGVESLSEAQKVAALIAVANTVPELRSHHDGFVLYYQELLGQPEAMHKLRLGLERALGFNTLERIHTVLNQIDQQVSP
jgi:hypothetical protein